MIEKRSLEIQENTWMVNLFRAAARFLSPSGRRGKLSILIYHRVLEKKDPLLPGIDDVHQFREQLLALKTCFNILPLAQALQCLKAGTLPERAASITFDDGYADNVTQALPVLQSLGLHATFFIATNYLDGGRMFNDTVIELIRRARTASVDLPSLGLERIDLSSTKKKVIAIENILASVKHLPFQERLERVSQLHAKLSSEPLPEDLMMSSAQLKTLYRSGMGIGAHTASHPILTRVPLADARRDILDGKARLESLLDTEIRLFAYPNGKPAQDYSAEHVRLIRELGFIGAVSTAWGNATRLTDCYQLPRFSPWDKRPDRFLALMLRNLMRRQQSPRLLRV